MELPSWLTSSSRPCEERNLEQTPQQHKKEPSLISRIRPHGAIRTQHADVYMKINLQDLEAYTQDVLTEERARRHKWYGQAGVCLGVLALLVWTGVWVDHKAHHNSSSSSMRGVHHNPALLNTEQEHPLAVCELQWNHTKTFSQLAQAYHSSTVQWCRVADCDWLNPTEPHPRQTHNQTILEEWALANEQSHQQIAYMLQTHGVPEDEEEGEANRYVDVALIGDSMIEHMLGRGGSRNAEDNNNNNNNTDTKVVDPEQLELEQQTILTQQDLDRDNDIFEQLFTKQGGGSMDGLALGIGGDRCSNLLWRLQGDDHTNTTLDTDETATNTGALLSPQFAPKVWWILMGTADWELGVGADAIVAGIVTVVETIRTVHPNAQIVINSLLPRASPEDNESVRGINNRISCFVKAQSFLDEDEHNLELVRQDLQSVSPEHQIPTSHPRPKRTLHFFNATNIFQERHDDGSFTINPALLTGSNDVNDSADDHDIDHNGHMHGERLWGQQIVANVNQLIEYEKE